MCMYVILPAPSYWYWLHISLEGWKEAVHGSVNSEAEQSFQGSIAKLKV